MSSMQGLGFRVRRMLTDGIVAVGSGRAAATHSMIVFAEAQIRSTAGEPGFNTRW